METDEWPLLDFSKFPNEIISGLSLQEINEIMNSDDPFIQQDDMQLLTEEQEEELRRIEKEAVPKGTFRQTENHVKKFKSFLSSKGLNENFETLSSSTLNDYLRLFYANLKMKNGLFYCPSSLVCFRASIQRHLSSPDINRKINIIHGDEFQRANGVLRAMVGKYLNSSQEKKNTYEAISKNDMNKIRHYFDRSSLQKLQDEVLFNVIFYFGLRGRENLRSLTTDCIKINEDDSGVKYCFVNTTMLSKNVKASLNSKENADLKQARMYETQEKDTCPVESFKKYKEYFTSESTYPSLFPKILQNGRLSTAAALGKTSLDNLMKRLSNTLELSKKYTNHCIRVSVVTVMREQGASTNDIMLVTGHKNAASVHRYERKRRDEDLRVISKKLTLATTSSPNEDYENMKVSTTNSKPQSINYFNLKISTNRVSENGQEQTKLSMAQENEETSGVKIKKAKLSTSWGVLEIDL